MATLDENFHVIEGGRWRRFRRDLRLVRFLFKITWGWIIDGGRVRKAHRRAAAKGEVMEIDALAGRGKYK
jgi:hypothetical protein